MILFEEFIKWNYNCLFPCLNTIRNVHMDIQYTPSCKCPVYLEEMKRSNEEWEIVEAEELEEMNNAAKELQDAIDEYGD